MNIETWRNPYDLGFSLTRPKEISIDPGVTVLVGCNGAGKTTLLQNINDYAQNHNIPCHLFDGQRDKANGMQLLIGYGDFDCDDQALGAALCSSSEGESLQLNIYRHTQQFDRFMNDGYVSDRKSRLVRSLRESDPDNEKPDTNMRILLFDAADSGLSIDVIIDLKDKFKTLLKRAQSNNIELYIIISANEYELCFEEKCIDVTTGKYCTFSSYDDFKKFIMESRNKKIKRLKAQKIWCEKQYEKELAMCFNKKEKIDSKITAIKDKARSENRDLSFTERSNIRRYEYSLTDMINSCRFVHRSDIFDPEKK